MVSILPPERSAWDVIGKQIGQNIGDVIPGAVQQGYNRGQLQQSLEKIKQIASDPSASPLDTMLAVMQAGAGIPGSEKYLATIMPEMVKFAEARRSQGIRQPGESQSPQQAPAGQQRRLREPLEPAQSRENLPNFLNQNQNFPNNIGPQGEIGQLPQPATTGKAIPLLTPSEMRDEAKKLAKESTAAGIPLTPAQALEQVRTSEEDKKVHNKNVEEERSQRAISQQEYGQRAAEYLKREYPNATPEQEAIFQKKGEIAAGRGESEAEINRYLATEAKNFKNAIVNVEKDISAPRLQNELQRKFLGNSKDFEQAANDLRVKLKPILDLGLYDTARNLLTNLGYYPEEREMIINPMSERQKTILNKVPQAPFKGVKVTGRGFAGVEHINPKIELGNIKSALMDLKQVDPNFSLVLARKALEDKGYDWRNYKDALNELESEGFKLTDDQQIQRGILDTPPLNFLEQMLHGLRIIGR